MKQTLFIIAFLALAFSAYAQSAEDDVVRLKNMKAEESVFSTMDGESGINDAPGPEEQAKKGHLGMSLGTSFSYMQGYGSLMGFYAAPTYTLSLNPRWALHTGLIASTYYGLNPPGYDGLNVNPAMKSLAVFAAASYRASDKLILHGSGVKSLVNYPVPPLLGYPSDQLSFGATYKLGDNVSIGASIHINQGGYYSGSPFQPGFGW